ncbi:MAG: FAD-binding protein, partial [Chloroflexota bacterium]|nr:FAD-binding protein [Chloroflexota bacterium]
MKSASGWTPGDTPMSNNLINWAGNYTYRALRLHQPGTVGEIQELVTRHQKLKALGTRHSFNNIADSPNELVSLQKFNRVLALDRAQRTVTIEAGVRYGELCRYLNETGYALHNLASLPHISVAGACATATHGSGDMHGNLATAVSALEIVMANGEVVSLAREKDGERFDGAVVSLGGLGIVTKLTLDILPA